MKKKTFSAFLLFAGVLLTACSFLFSKNEAYKTLQGAFLGIGTAGVGVAFSNLLMIHWYRRHPGESEQVKIDAQDERNQIIRNKAKAKCSDIIQWAVLGLAWITIFAGSPLWMTLLLIGIFLSKNILELILMDKYNHEM